jgi:integrase/recombinase XerD
MNFSDGIEQYVIHKRATGVEFVTGQLYLNCLFRRLGDVELGKVTTEQVMTFLDDSVAGTATWRMKYHAFVHFFDFWAARDAMPYLPFPSPKPKIPRRFVPYVYSPSQIKMLLRRRITNLGRAIDHITMRTFMLTLYGTGAVVGEVIDLLVADVNVKAGNITIKNKNLNRCRQIPICDDLCDILRSYLGWRKKRKFENPRLFVTENDWPVSHTLLDRKFRRLCELANITREKSAGYQPRLHDFRCTFAVHRITSWIRSGTDLNRMLPALGAYMGLSLCSTERYLYMTPERFKKPLGRLSPKGIKRHWRNDKNLMDFLASL